MTDQDEVLAGAFSLCAYGEHVKPLLVRTREAIEPAIDSFVDRFYREIVDHEGFAAVLGRLTPDELMGLKTGQAEHLRWLLDPDLDRCLVIERGRRVGRVHAKVAVEIDWYASALARYQAGIFDHLAMVASAEERTVLQRVVSARLVHDLEGVLRGYRDVEECQAEVLQHVSEVLDRAETVADLARHVLEVLTDLDGVIAGSFGRPDAFDRLQFEIGVGNGITVFRSDGDGAPITTSSSEASGNGPGGRAWRSGEIERSDSYLTDATTAPWHELGHRFGWRASATIPLSGATGEPRALLVLYASHPGYFAHSSRKMFLLQLRSAVERALSRIEARHGSAAHVVAYRERSSYLEMLDTGKVVMLYQPVVELTTGRLLKLEALGRLGSAGNLVSPAEFLPSFGDDELFRLFEIGLDQALGSLVAWQSGGLETAVSLNLPASCGSDHRYVAVVERALARYGVVPSRLTLELLETGSLGSDWDRHARGLDELKRLGVRLAEDDLGSGYSSLLRLRNIAFDEVKIDQELMRGAESAPRAALHFIQPLASLARSMGLVTSVEGLETAGLIEAAVVLGADAGQGYAIARPLPHSEVPKWAAGFSLDIDRDRPRTWLGGIAAHLVWENRLAALARGSGLLGRAARNSCALGTYIDEHDGDRDALADAHRSLHAVTVRAAGSAAYEEAWSVLEKLLIGGRAGSVSQR